MALEGKGAPWYRAPLATSQSDNVDLQFNPSETKPCRGRTELGLGGVVDL